MKTNRFLFVVAFVAIVFAFFACSDEPKDDPQPVGWCKSGNGECYPYYVEGMCLFSNQLERCSDIYCSNCPE